MISKSNFMQLWMLPREKLNIRNIHGPFPFHLITVVERRGFFGWITDQAQELAHKTFYSWLARYSSVNLDWLVRNAVLWSPGFDREFNIGLANPPLPPKGQSSLLKARYSRASVVENKINTTWFWRRYWPFSLIKTFIWWICSGKNPLHSFVVRENMLKVCNKWIIFMLSFRAVFIAEFCFSRLAHYKWPKPKKKMFKFYSFPISLGQIWFWPQPVTAHENDIQKKNQKWEVQSLLQSWSEQRVLFFHNNSSASHTSLSGWSII